MGAKRKMKDPIRSEAGRKAWETMRKGKRIKVHSPTVRRNGHGPTGAKSPHTYAPPKRWWDYMTKEPHGKQQKPLSPAAAGHLWFKVYNDKKRLEILKEWS